MAFSKSLVLMSPMKGKLVLADGSPASGVRLVRRWEWTWTGDEGGDETTTDSAGRFRFESVFGHSLTARLLPHQPSIFQTITADTKTGDVLIWDARKGGYELNGELWGEPLNVVCGLDGLPGPDSQRLFLGTCISANP